MTWVGTRRFKERTGRLPRLAIEMGIISESKPGVVDAGFSSK
jgi:hypothetical protein